MYYSFRCNMYPFFSIHVCITYDMLFLFAFTYRFKPYSQVVFICFLCCYHQQCCILQFTYICICYEEKKKLHILHEKWQEEKNTWKETGWNSTNSLTYVTSKCILKLIRISLIYLYSEQSVYSLLKWNSGMYMIFKSIIYTLKLNVYTNIQSWFLLFLPS